MRIAGVRGYSQVMTERRHHIQRHVLQLLIDNRVQRYAQLRPANVEANQFVYHLKQLMREDLVQKRGSEGYELTEKGRVYADKFDPSTFAVPWEVQPRSVLFLAVHADDKGWLLIRRSKQPTIGKIGFISCNPAIGSTITDAAESYLLEQFSMTAQFSYAASGSITLKKGGGIESYVHFQLLSAENPGGTPSSTDIGWYQGRDLEEENILPSTAPLLAVLTGKHPAAAPQFIELAYELD